MENNLILSNGATMKKLSYVLKNVSELSANPRNARTHNKKQIDKIANSIKEFGFISPAIIDGAGILVAGHGRLEAAKKIGMKEIPCIIADHLSPEQLRAYMLADNRIQLDAGWDEEMLKVELNELSAAEFDVSFTGFDESEISGHTRQGAVEGEDDAPAPEENPVSKLGDIWILGDHRVMCGDSTSKEQVEKLMNGQKVDCIHTDPPYGLGKKMSGGTWATKSSQYKDMHLWDVEAKQDFFNACMINVPCVIWGGNYFTTPPSRGWLVWKKPYFPTMADCEIAFTNIDMNARVFEGKRSDSIKIHPTQKPLEVVEWALGFIDGKNVLDLFLGSGSTLIACEKTGRKCFGMELSEAYCDVIVKRWQDFTGKKAVHAETGKLFNDQEIPV